MGKKVIDVISSGASNKSYFSNTYFLYFVLITLVLSAVLLGGCNVDPGDDNLISDCIGVIGGDTEINPEDKRVLCVGNYEGRADPEDVCLREVDGDLVGSTKYIDQSISTFVYHVNEKATGWQDCEAADVAAISAAYLFGDGCSGSIIDHPNSGDGFLGHSPPDHCTGGNEAELGDETRGGRADGVCATKFSFDVGYLDADKKVDSCAGAYYGLDDENEIGVPELQGAGVTDIPLVFVCSDEVPDNENFDLGGSYTTEGMMVTQIVDGQSDEEGASEEVPDEIHVYYCDCETESECEWIELYEMADEEEYDQDGDFAPDILGENWDCDSSDPTKFTDLSIFYGFDSSNMPAEICGDGKDNFCRESSLYTIFEDYYKDYYEINNNEEWSLDAWTADIDNCDLNPEACIENCLVEGRNCDYIVPVCDPYVDEGCENYAAELDINNAEGYCCGAKEADDIGNIIPDPYANTNSKLCINSGEEVMIGGDVESFEEGCSGWCWVSPQTNHFEVLTIKKMGEKTYDVVSNSDVWVSCDETYFNNKLPPPTYTDYLKDANSFICYDQGDRNVWARCMANTELDGEELDLDIKTRLPGDAVFALTNEVSSYDVDFHDDYSTENSFYYDQELDVVQSLDFTGYDYLEFYVKFDSIKSYPVDVNLIVRGEAPDEENPDNIFITYFDQNVLGYAVNAPLIEEGRWIHVKVPITEWINVRLLSFIPESETNDILVKNVHLTKEEEETDYICSGYEALGSSSWMENLDFSEESNPVMGDLICTELYGEDAWLGHSGEEEVESDENSCCGNNENEYYAGITANEDGRGCWNSEVVQDDQTVMNVEYTVDYYEEEYPVSYPELNCEYNLIFDRKGTVNTLAQSPFTISYNESPNIVMYMEDSMISDFVEYPDDTIGTISVEKTNCDDGVYLSLFLDGQQDRMSIIEVKYGSTLPEYFDYSVIAETDVINKLELTTNPIYDEAFSYPCLQEECIYALPGVPPYTVINSNPGLYELYFITSDNEEEDILITEGSATYEDFANLKVKKLSQQVLYYNQSFWGCNAAAYIENTGIFDNYDGENLNACDIEGSYYCAYQDENYLINTWSDQGIVEYGYEEIAEYEEGMEFEPATCSDYTMDCTATARNHSTNILPGRNFINNANFISEGKDVIGWELWTIDDTVVEDEDDYVVSDTFTVSSGYILKSERLALYPDEDYEFSQSSTCTVTINLYDKDGNEFPTTENFNSEKYSYLTLEVAGSCDFSLPMLQLTDDLEANEYNYDTEFPQRKAAACCPEMMCWNGYMCVNDMSTYTYMTENSGNNTYRCIAGAWTHMDPKYDWNGEEYGFCTNNEQCFVTSSLSEGADAEASLTDFYDGSYPTCIESNQYLMDHYCEEGEWSSRTRFLATKLLNYAESDDYVMYCSNLQNNLLDYAVDGYNYANYLEGESAVTVDVEADLGDALAGDTPTQETGSVCFPDISTSETGRRLVPYEENTCINNVCVLKYAQGDGFTTAFATSMNLNKSDDQSILIPLGISSSELETYCTESEESSDQFVECSDKLWYAADINSLIYAKEGISISGNVIDEVLDWFSGLFGNDAIQDTEDFVSGAQNFNNVYIMNMEGGKYVVRAIEEIDGNQQTLITEYQGFSSPICDYVNNVAEEYVQVEQWPAAPENLVNCTLDETGVYRVITGTDIEFWWPQLAGKMRTGIE
jgi:hypothetical protein